MTAWPELIERLRTLHTEILRVAPFRDIGLVPNPGAGASAIEAAEARIGLPLPPSYRALLARHDGWPRFFEGASLLGSACLGNRVYDDFARAAFEAAQTPFPELGSPLRDRKYARVVPFGVDLQSTTLFAFNPDVCDADGEYEVIAWINELGVRSTNLTSFLELLVELTASELDAHLARHELADDGALRRSA